jgi:hypothetical protein
LTVGDDAGYSIGKWVDEDGDGKYDVLEVETRFLKDVRAYDVNGYPFADDGRTIIKERFFLDKSDPNIIYDEITVMDNALTQPYTKLMKALRNPNPRPIWLSEVCQEGNNWIKISDEAYYISVDGKLMPSKKGQQPPDLSLFRPFDHRPNTAFFRLSGSRSTKYERSTPLGFCLRISCHVTLASSRLVPSSLWLSPWSLCRIMISNFTARRSWLSQLLVPFMRGLRTGRGSIFSAARTI